ncbi:MAG: tryptophan--tRNA ligase [Acidimicrobiales bacterium]
MTRVFSGIQPSGAVHVGNYLGAVRQWARDQYEADSYYCVVDLHGLTAAHDPAELRRRTLETAIGLVAAGLDPDACTLFVQSHVAEHAQLSWLLECTASFGELGRMTQFKEKASGQASVRAGLFTYPVLMAADILLYDTERVPVGDDQRQHLELTRDLATRFNGRYGDTFVIPEAAVPNIGARVMDLQHPSEKMSKSVHSPLGTITVLDSDDDIRQKIRRAVTDTDGEMRHDPGTKPGLSNLIEMLAAATDAGIEEVTSSHSSYRELKEDLAEALVVLLAPLRERHSELASDPRAMSEVLEKGADKAAGVARVTLRRAEEAIGLLVAREL